MTRFTNARHVDVRVVSGACRNAVIVVRLAAETTETKRPGPNEISNVETNTLHRCRAICWTDQPCTHRCRAS